MPPPGRHDHHRSSGRSRDRYYSDDWDRNHGYRTSGRSRSLERKKKDMHRPGHAVRDEYTPSLRSSSVGRDSKRYRDPDRDHRTRDERTRKDWDREYRDRARELEERERELSERERQYRRERDRDYRSYSDDDLDRNRQNDRYRDSMRRENSRDRLEKQREPDNRYDTRRRRGSRDEVDRRDNFRDISKSSDSLEKIDPIKAEKANTLSRSRRADDDPNGERLNRRRSKRSPDNDQRVYERERSEKEKFREKEERENREREEQERRAREEQAKREREEQERKKKEERDRREKEERDRREKEERARRDKEEKDRRDKEERARRDKEERDRRDKEERDRREKEERDRRDKEERDRREREERDRRDREREERDRREREYTRGDRDEHWKQEEAERLSYEERIRRDKEQYERDRRKAIEYENERMKERSFYQHQYDKEREVFEQERYIDAYHEPPGYGHDYSWGHNSNKPIVVAQNHRRGPYSKTMKNVVRCCSVLHIIFCFCLAALSIVAWVFYNGLLAIGPFVALVACLLLAIFGFLSVMKHNSKFMIVVKFITIVCLLALMVVMIVYCYLAGSYIGDPSFRHAYHRDHVAYISVACLFVLIPAWLGSIILVYVSCRHTCCLPANDDRHQHHGNDAVYYNP